MQVSAYSTPLAAFPGIGPPPVAPNVRTLRPGSAGSQGPSAGVGYRTTAPGIDDTKGHVGPLTNRVATSPGISRIMANTMTLTRKSVGTASATRRRTYRLTRGRPVDALLVEPRAHDQQPERVAVVVLEALHGRRVGDILRGDRQVDIVRLVGQVTLDLVDDLAALVRIELPQLGEEHLVQLGVGDVRPIVRLVGEEAPVEPVVHLGERRNRPHRHLLELALTVHALSMGDPRPEVAAEPREREELPRESSLLGGHHDDADRSAAEAAEPLDHAPVEAMALEPASLVPRDPLVTHAVELGPDGLARGSEVGEPRVGAPLPRELGLGRSREQRVHEHRHLPAGLHEGPEPREALEEAGRGLGRYGRTQAPIGAPGRLEVLTHPVAENAVEVEREDRGRGHDRGL